MSQRTSVGHAICEMENDIYSVLRYAQALSYVASSPHLVEPECLTALSDPLEEIGKRLREQFKAAHAAASGGQQ
jgi:hypothetical protein